MEDAAAELDCARSRISQLETGRYGVRKPDLVALLRLYGALDQLDALEELRREGGKRGWWSTSKLPKWLHAYIGLEEDAVTAQIFSLELIPGLIQTEDYAHAVHFGRHCCFVRSGKSLDSFGGLFDQMAGVSSVKAAITRSVGGSSMPSS